MRKKLCIAGLVLLAVAGWWWMRDARPSSKDIDTMTPITQQMKPQCVGRYLIHMPDGALASGRYETQIASIAVETKSPRSVAMFISDLDAKLGQRQAALSAKLMPKGNGSRFLALQQPTPYTRMLNFMTDGDEPDGKVDGYVVRAGGVFLLQSDANDANDVKEFTDFLVEIEPMLSIRDQHSIPTAPGFCIDDGLVAMNPKRGENVNSWSWDLPGHPDVRFAFSSRTNGNKVDPGIVDREGEIFREAGAALMGQIQTLRRRRFELNGMKAQEWSRVAKDEHPSYQFDIEIPGAPNDNAHPGIHLSMRVGGKGKPAAPSLSQGEALALWDAVTSTLRLRPGAL